MLSTALKSRLFGTIGIGATIQLVCLFFDGEAVLLGDSLPRLELPVDPVAFFLELVIGRAELCNRLFGEKLLQRPLLDGLLFVLLELGDVSNGVLQNRPLIFLASGNDLSQLIDALIDGFTTSTLDCALSAQIPWPVKKPLQPCRDFA